MPPGKIAAVATYLERRAPPAVDPRPEAGAAAAGRFEPLGGDVARYRALYAAVGGRWLWFSRAALSDRQLAAAIAPPSVEALAFAIGGRDLGLLELDFRTARECELSFLGLVPEAIGRGHGSTLMAEALRRAFSRPIERLWLHTCTLDHPSALPFYLRAGFTAYARAIEVADDPRLVGRMPRSVAPDVPLL